MAKAIPDYAIEVRDVSDEIAALREAVEILESMESEARISARVVTSARDYYLKNWEAQRDEAARLSGQVKDALTTARINFNLLQDSTTECRKLHKTIDTILFHATTRKLYNDWEKAPKFWYRSANGE